MLQQTQAATVIPYFERMLARFPDLPSLADATQDEVLALWTGLGYYARGRNLHRAAQIIVEQYNGHFPDQLSALMDLPGVGQSTAGAILASGFDKRGVINDANVKRVLARFHIVKGHVTTSKTSKQLWSLADKHTPNKHFANYNQAIMDLGASLCGRKTLCQQCPLVTKCEAHKADCVVNFPQKKKAKIKTTRQVRIFVINNQLQQLYLEKQPAKGVWGGLWSPPIRPRNCTTTHFLDELNVSPPELVSQTIMPQFRHTFSHYHLEIEPVLINLDQTGSISEDRSEQPTTWYNVHNNSALGLSAVAVKLIQQFKDSI